MLRTTALIGAGATFVAATPALAVHNGYSLGDNGRTLVTMDDLTAPSMVTGTALDSDVQMNSLAYRPQTGQLYGWSSQNDTVYTVDIDSGSTNPVASTDDGIDVDEVGFDFNNQVDAARAVSTDEDNLVFFPEGDDGAADVQRFNDLFYAEGDPYAGEDPSVFANAYTNQVPNASTTQQYVFDSEQNTLATLANNAGTLETVGQVAVDGEVIDFTSTGGFDIYSPSEGENMAYGLLTTAQGTGLYQLSGLTANGNGFVDAEFLGMTGDEFGALDGLATFARAEDTPGPAPAPIPLPAAAWLLGGSIAGLGALRQTRKRRG